MVDAGHVMISKPRRIAVLIDGDYIDQAYFGRVLAEADRHGTNCQYTVSYMWQDALEI